MRTSLLGILLFALVGAAALGGCCGSTDTVGGSAKPDVVPDAWDATVD